MLETANPRSYYDLLRRKLGMVMGTVQTTETQLSISHKTSVPNVFITGDTVSNFANVASVSEAALGLANEIHRPAL